MDDVSAHRTAGPEFAIRLLVPGDEGVVRELATFDGPGDPEALLADPRTLMLVAVDEERPVGFVLAHELPRRHGDRSKLFVYEVEVAETHRRRGVGKALLGRLAELARERGIRVGFVLTDPGNGPANALYRSAGGATETVTVQWEFSYADGGRLTTLRPAGMRDVDRLVAWHADPEVARYWDDETFTRAEMEERLARPDVEAWIVEEADEPVGYLQVHPEGLDMFLVPEARGRGLGPDAARAMARHLLDERGWSRVTADPYAWNEGAVRAWRRAGFVEVSRHEAGGEHTAPWILMEFVG